MKRFLSVLIVVVAAIAIGCSGGSGGGGSTTETALSQTITIYGVVVASQTSLATVLPIAPAPTATTPATTTSTIKRQMISGQIPVPNALVWLEEDPENTTISDQNGAYSFSNLKPGSYHVVVQYNNSGGKKLKSRSGEVLVDDRNPVTDAGNLQIQLADRTVWGILRDAAGNPLPAGTALTLWGEKFFVKEGGFFETPGLPEGVAIAEIKVAATSVSGPLTLKAPLFSPSTPSFIETMMPPKDAVTANTPPVAFLTALKNGVPTNEVSPGEQLILNAEASDIDPGDGSQLIFQWSTDRGLLATATNRPQEAIWTPPTESGLAHVALKVTDPKGAFSYTRIYLLVGISQPLVPIDFTPPEVTSVCPIADAAGVEASSTIVLRFSRAMASTTFSPSTFLVSSGSQAIDGGLSFSEDFKLLTFSPTGFFPGSASITVFLSREVTDDIGNKLLASLTWTFGTIAAHLLPGATPLSIAVTTPASGALDVSTESMIAVTFNRAVASATVSPTSFTVSASGTVIPGTLSLNAGETVVTFQPSARFPYSTTITLNLGVAIADKNSVALAGPVSLSFITARNPDATAPSVTISAPVAAVTNVSPIPVTVVFSEGVTGFALEKMALINGVGANFTAVSAATYTFSLTPSATGTVQIGIPANSAVDAAGNGNTVAASFTTRFDNSSLLPGTLSPADNATGVSSFTTLVMVFNKAVIKGAGSILLKNDSDGLAESIDVTTASVTASGSEVRILPAQPLGNLKNYHVEIPASAFIDDAGNTFPGFSDAVSWNFSVADTAGPTVTSVQVVDGTHVDVTFSKTLGTGADTATNYSLSGAGKGTLAVNPNSVVLQSGSTFRLAWTAGEMKNGGDITITVVGIQDSLGNTLGAPNSGTHSGGGIGTAPTVTIASLNTNDTTPPLGGAVNDAGAVITVTVNGVTYNAVNNGDGTWTLADNTIGALPSNTYDVLVSAVDLAGNSGTDSTTNELVIDSVEPSVQVVSSPQVDGTYSVGTVIDITLQFSKVVLVTGTPQLTLETGGIDRVVDYSSGDNSNTLTFQYSVQAGDTTADLDYLNTTALALNGGTIQDALANNAILTLPAPGGANSLGANKALVIDTGAPTAAITYSVAGPYKSGAAVTITATFNESMKDAPVPQIAVSGAHSIAATNMTKVSDTEYTYSYSAGIGNGACTVAMSTGTDQAGNVITSAPTSGAGFTLDNTAPTSAITYSVAGPYKSGAAVTITATFNESMKDAPIPQIAVSGAHSIAATNMTKVSDTEYTYSYSAGIGNGACTVAMSTGTDQAGNVITSAPTSGAGFTLDNTAPTAAITYSVAGPYKSGAAVTITATFNESMKDAPVPQMAISGAHSIAATNMTKVSDTEYTYSYSAGIGNGACTVAMSTGTDQAGNVITSAPTSGAGFTLDNTAPTAAITYSVAGPYKSGAAVTITATFNESMKDAPVPQIAVSGAHSIAATNMTKVSDTEYTYSYSAGIGNGACTVAMSTGTDQAGNGITSAPTSGAGFTLDNTAPTAAITYSVAGPYKSGAAVTITATFNESMKDAPVPQIAVSGAHSIAATNMTKVSDTEYTYSYSAGIGNGACTVAMSTGTDQAGNGITSAPTSGAGFTLDNTAPTAAITYSVAGPYKSGAAVTITATFNESMKDAPVPQVAVSGAHSIAATNMTKVSDTEYTYSYSAGIGNGACTVAMSTGTDQAGNGITSAPTSGATFTLDNTAPTAAITYSVAGPYKSGAAVTITATFNEDMKDAPVPQIAISGTHTVGATNMTKVSATEYTYSYSAVAGDGGCTIALSTGTDLAGNAITSAPTSGATFTLDNTAPTVTTKLGDGSSPFSLGAGIPGSIIFSENVSAATKIAVQGAITLGADNAPTFNWPDDSTLEVTGAAGTGSNWVADVTNDITDPAGNTTAGDLLIDTN